MLHTFRRLRRILVLVLGTALGTGLLIAVAAPSNAIVTGSSTISISIHGYGTTTVGPTSSTDCTSPASTAQGGAYACTSITGADHDSCTSDGNGDSSCHVTLSVTAPSGWHFGGWSGDCSGVQTCTLETSFTSCDPELKPPCSTEYESHALGATFVDDRAPTTLFSRGPSNNSVVYGDNPTQSFAWSTDENSEGPSFACKKDAGTFTACSSGLTWSSISDGIHDFCVHGTDATGLQGADACRHWEQETNPTASVSGHPDSTTSSRDASFTYTSNKAGHANDGSTLAYECSLDGAGFASCAGAGKSYSGLSNGPHTFAVHAIFSAALGGGPHTSAGATYSWTQDDQTAPNITVTDAPSGVVITDTRAAHIEWTGDDAADNQTFTCKLDNAAYTSCTAPLELTNMADGVHTLQIEGSNELGNTGPVTSVTWDQEAPANTVITGGPAAGSTVPKSTATFSFGSSKDGAQFECKLDQGKYTPCSGAGSDTLAKLSPGAHTFAVRAVWVAPLDSSTHRGAAVTRKWNVLGKPSCTVAPLSPRVVHGKIAVKVNCDLAATAVVRGTVTETVKKKHGSTTKKVTLAGRQTKVSAGKATTVTLSLGSAWAALKNGAKEAAVFSVKALNAAGSKIANSRPVKLHR